MKFRIWAKERFPFLNVTTAFVMAVAAKFAVLSDLHVMWSLKDLLCGLIALCHLFLLRVLDEHKDFESDRIYHPERVLQKGLISLKDIRRYGGIALLVQILSFLSLQPSKIAWISFAFLWFWTGLMYKEFGMKNWLRPRIFLYSFSHLLVSPILFFTLATFYGSDSLNSSSLQILLALSLATGFLYEISRKTKSKEEDQKGEISFSLVYGRKFSSILISLAAATSLVLGAAYLPKPGVSELVYWVGGLLLFLLLIQVLWKFNQDPVISARKKNEGVAGLISIWVLLFPIINFVLQTSHEWTLWS